MKQDALEVVMGWAPVKRRSFTVVFFYAIVVICAFIATRYINLSTIAGTKILKGNFFAAVSDKPQESSIPERDKSLHLELSRIRNMTSAEFPLECVGRNLIQTCPKDYPRRVMEPSPSNHTCQSYFRWIHEDLRPWKANGITREMVESAKRYAYFRLVVVDGKPYMEKYRGSFQTRDIFTVWGILQLLRLYPGRLPDLDIMFECGDKPVVKKADYPAQDKAPVLFHYCGDDTSLDIAFPDWSFWGWPEINIKPWELLKKDLREGTKKIKLKNRLPHAYWKGNFYMGDRKKLLDCNSTHEWNTDLRAQNWDEETKHGFKSSNLADQCKYMYKIYIEGIAWSVSEKYILSCDSMTLLVNPKYYEFFTRSLEPMKHFWPINPKNICKSVKFATDWGNRHPDKVQKIGKAGSKFVQQELEMENVYDYMFHLLKEYGKLLKYKPTIPLRAIEVCPETLACSMEGLDQIFKIASMVKSPSRIDPCTMSEDEDPQESANFIKKQESVRKSIDSLVLKGNINVDIV